MRYLSQFSRRSFLRSSTLAIASFIATTSCSQQNQTSDSQTSTTQSQPLRLGFNLWAGFMPWKVAQEKDFFSKNDLKAEVTWFPVLSDQIAAFNAQKIDVVGITMSDFLNSISGGVKAKAISVTDISLGADAIVVAPSIKSFKDMEGKNASIEVGTVGHFLFLKGLEENGVAQDKVEIFNQPADAAIAALIAGKTEIAYAYEPFVSQAVSAGKGKVIYSSKDVPGSVPDLLIVQQRIIDSQPEAVEKLLKVWYQTIDYRKSNLDEVLAIEAKQAGTSVDEYKKLLEGFKWLTPEEAIAALKPGNTNESMIYTAKEVSDFMVGQKLINKEPPAFKDLIDDSFLKKYAAS